MKHIFILVTIIVLLKTQRAVAQCSSGSLPLLVRGETVQQCSGNDAERQSALQALNTRVDSEIQSLLPRIEAFLTPSPCSGPDWKRVVYLNMTNPDHSCPPNWASDEISGKRVCSRSPRGNGCVKATFQVDDIIGKYSRVCGRIVAYKYGDTEGLGNAITEGKRLNSNYIDGVSITHGSNPMRHIWTFAAGSTNAISHIRCPCDNSEATLPEELGFINGSFFCESGGQTISGGLITDNPLWDGHGCDAGSSCCMYNNPPYFSVALDEATCDDIDVRLCGDDANEDTPIELIELYVK